MFKNVFFINHSPITSQGSVKVELFVLFCPLDFKIPETTRTSLNSNDDSPFFYRLPVLVLPPG